MHGWGGFVRHPIIRPAEGLDVTIVAENVHLVYVFRPLTTGPFGEILPYWYIPNGKSNRLTYLLKDNDLAAENLMLGEQG